MSQSRIRKSILWIVCCLVVLLIGAVSFRYYNAYRFHVEKQTRFMMDTFVTIYTVGPQKIADEALRAAFDRMQSVDAKFSTQNPEGAVYAFNHNNAPITDSEIISVVDKALAVARATDGAFDITIQPLIELWGFYGDHPAVPKAEDIAACLKNTGFEHLHIQDGKLTKDHPQIRIDLGGIAKGYAIGQAVVALKSNGINSALIDAGGDVYALGKRGADLWKVGLRNPRGDDLIAALDVENKAVMGSGDYQRFFMENGRRYHHIFDPKTGYPARGVIGTTLVHPDPTLADAWNTAIFILGPEKGLSLAEKMPDMEAVMVTDAKQLQYTSGLSDVLQINNQAKPMYSRR